MFKDSKKFNSRRKRRPIEDCGSRNENKIKEVEVRGKCKENQNGNKKVKYGKNKVSKLTNRFEVLAFEAEKKETDECHKSVNESQVGEESLGIFIIGKRNIFKLRASRISTQDKSTINERL